MANGTDPRVWEGELFFVHEDPGIELNAEKELTPEERALYDEPASVGSEYAENATSWD